MLPYSQLLGRKLENLHRRGWDVSAHNGGKLQPLEHNLPLLIRLKIHSRLCVLESRRLKDDIQATAFLKECDTRCGVVV